MDVNMIREFGPMVALLSFFAALMAWVIYTLIQYFLKAIDAATNERQAMTKEFTAVVSNHIAHSTEAQNNVCLSLRELTSAIATIRK